MAPFLRGAAMRLPILCCLVLYLLCAANAQQYLVQMAVNSISPSEGSIGGGTRLVLTGQFYNNQEGSNLIWVGPYQCVVIVHLSTDTLLTCETSAGAEGTYPVTVLGSDSQSSNQVTVASGFSYRGWATPTLAAVGPMAGPPGSQVYVYGSNTWAINQDCTSSAAQDDASYCLSGILFQDYRCQFNLENVASTYTGNLQYGRLNSWNFYRLNCTLPDPLNNGDNNAASFPGLGVAKKVNTTVHFEASMRGGMPVPQQSAYTADGSGWPYMFQLYAEVSNVSPSSGSLAGGTTLTITGRGFPTLAMNVDNVTVSVAGVNCTVLSSNYTTITCVTGPLPSNYVAPQPIKGLYPGLRGLSMQFWNNTGSTQQFNRMWLLNSSWTPASDYTTATVTDEWESPFQTGGSQCAKGTAFFTAPVAGSYQFLMASDDFGSVNGTWYLANGTLASQTLAVASPWTSPDQFNKYASQVSAPVDLTAGQSILLESSHCNTVGSGFQQVGVVIPSSTPTWASRAEVQQIAISGSRTLRTIQYKYSWPVGSTLDNIATVSVTSTITNNWVLNDPRAGITLTLNNRTITFSTNATTDSIVSTIRSALSISSSPATSVGVSRSYQASSGGNSVATYTIAINKTVVPTLTFSAELTFINTTVPTPWTRQNFTVPNGCSWINPFLQQTQPATQTYPGPPATPALDQPTLASLAALTSNFPVQLTGVSNPAGSWALAMPGSNAFPLSFSHTIAAANVSAQFAALTGVSPASASFSAGVREGPYLSNIWTIATAVAAGNNWVYPNMVSVGDAPQGVQLVVSNTVSSSDYIQGNVSLALGNFCDSVVLKIGTDTQYDIANKLKQLPFLNRRAPRSVTLSGNSEYGWTITVTFDPVATPGDVPPITVTSANLTGTYPAVTVTTLTNGTTNWWYNSIPTEFLQLPTSSPTPVRPVVNGVPSACAPTASAGACAFTYNNPDASPSITAVSPTTLDFSSVASLSVTITGTLFSATAASNVVQVGGAPCSVTAASTTSITCTIDAVGTPSGSRPVSVLVGTLGYAANAPNVTVQVLKVTGVTPATVAASAGMTVLNITGRGFDDVNCANNLVSIGGVSSGVISCAKAWVQVLFYDSANALVGTNADVSIKLVSDTGTTLDTFTSSGALTVSASAAALQSAPSVIAGVTLPGSGFTITGLFDSSTTASAVASMFLLPVVPTTFSVAGALAQAANLSAAFATTRLCQSVAVDSGNSAQVICTMGPVPNGWYVLGAKTSGGVTLITPAASFQAGIFLTSVSPVTGSIGGGTTLTITGSGFNAASMTSNVVLLQVPVSTTYLNGQALCDVKTATSTQLTCVTRPLLATDAAADDPLAFKVEPVASQPAQVTVVACNPNLSDILKLQCWSQGNNSAVASSLAPASTQYNYDWSVTPTIVALSNSSLQPGSALTITGAQLANVAEVQLRQGSQVINTCTSPTVSATSIACTLPASLSAGSYTIVLKTSSNEFSVDPSAAGQLVVYAFLNTVTPSSGSLAGGTSVSLTVNGTQWNTTLSNNVVTVGGASCTVTAVSGATLTCTTGPTVGRVRAEYWNLPSNSWNVQPDILSYVQPVLSRTELGATLAWGSASPGTGITADWFAARFTFYLQIITQGNYKFFLNGDDQAKLWVNDLYLGAKGASNMNITLSPGHVKVQLTLVEYAGSASLSLQWDAGVAASAASIPWFRIFPYAPGTPADITASINGVSVLQGCGDASIAFSNTNPLLPTPEPTTVSTTAPRCTYVFSSYMTPSLTKPLPTTAVTAAGNIGFTGAFLAGLDPAQYTVTIGGQACPVVSIATNATDSASQDLSCTLPALPAGKWPLVISVAGYGNTRAAPILSSSVVSAVPTITFGVSITRVTSLPTASPVNIGSYTGGATFTITGFGFAANNLASNKTNMVAVWSGGGNVAGTPTLTVSSATATSLTLSVGRFPVAAFPVATAVVSATYALYVYDAPLSGPVSNSPNTTVSTTFTLQYSAAYTPKVTSMTPATQAPSAGGSLTVAFSLGIGSASGLAATTVGAASQATVQLQSGLDVFTCSSPTATASTVAASSFTESLTCTLPAYLPANTYLVWVCVTPIGCGHSSTNYTVPLTVSAVSPTTGSAAGGQIVTVTGTGFDTANTSNLLVTFGTAPCAVTAATASSLTCTMGALVALPAGTSAQAVSVRPARNATTQTFSGVTYTFDASVTPTVTAVSPTRGSTAGGTALTITGTGFPTNLAAGQLTITIGGNTCTDPTVVSTTQITCTTSAPSPKNTNPQPIVVSFPNGNAWSLKSDGTPVTYQYVDLWSRSTTWGGASPPGAGYIAMIPAGITVLLDVSTPVLASLVLEGSLVFDDTQGNTEIQLNTNLILVKGGNLTIGTNNTPYPGRARITLYGPPYSRELPLYGAKTIAVRDGYVTMRGQAKTPTWTLLANTVSPGATSLTVQGPVNWLAGDLIAVASSSFFANETYSGKIVSNSYNSATNVTTLVVDQPFIYTHLGVTVPVNGDSYGRTIDMRAEVVCLTRNIVIEGDDSSPQWMYGGQIMVNTPRSRPRAQLQLEQVELRQMGQAFRLGRYTVHWHMHGDVGYQSWLKGCAFHHTYNRAATIHGTHNVITRDCVTYETMGHTFFLEDGIETGNIYENNVVILARRSDALLITDTTPACFWVTNPNNTYRNNRAAGSTNGYGFWYRFLKNPEGPSFTTSVCPKFTPMGEFTNNIAHSNMFYGLRVHPEFLPKLDPCGPDPDNDGAFAQVPATFQGLLSYKNGMKGAIATQVGLVRFANMTLVDNGGGPRQHVVNGKDNGAGYELTWIVDDRNRKDVDIYSMAGLFDSVVVSQTQEGQQGSAGRWPSGRKITGVIMHSPAEFHVKHTALGALVNVTFVNYTNTGSQFKGALEFCGKCKAFQGGATTFVKSINFLQTGYPYLSDWSWGHQGVFQDTDGSLINSRNLPASLTSRANFQLGVANLTWHSAVDSNLFDPIECVYVKDSVTSNNGAFCSSAVKFRRVMLHNHQPPALLTRALGVSSNGGAYSPVTRYNGTSWVNFTHYNEEGYQFTVPTGRDYYLRWDMSFRLDPNVATYHKADPLGDDGWVTLSHRLVQKFDHMEVNGVNQNLTATPTLGATSGAVFYNSTLAPDWVWYGNQSYNATTSTTYIAGNIRHANAYNWASFICPDAGCNTLPNIVIDVRSGVLRWSDPATWATRTPPGKPVAGENVTIPQGWNLLIDEDITVTALIVQGNTSFDQNKNVTIVAKYVIVMNQGSLTAGTKAMPWPANSTVTIRLNGTRQTPEWALSNTVNLGAKTLAAVNGGRIDFFGAPVAQRWTRLAATAAAGATQIKLAYANLGWRVGQQVLIGTTSWNWNQAEIRTITAIASDNATLTLDQPLTWNHTAKIVDVANAANGAFDMRAEVAMISSNLVVTADDAQVTRAPGGELFGGRVYATGASILRLSHTLVSYCGQGGLLRSAVMLDNMTAINPQNYPNVTLTSAPLANGTTSLANPSYVDSTAITFSMDGGLELIGAANNPIALTNNVLYQSFDRSTVIVSGPGRKNIVSGNLAVGTIKDMSGKNMFDFDMPSTYMIFNSDHVVTNNVAGGGERVGFMYYGIPCSNSTAALSLYSNNSAHSYLVGAWLRASPESMAAGCTALYNFTTYLNWDFGVISTKGIDTDVELTRVNAADSKFSNLLILRRGGMQERAYVTMTNITTVGMSGPDVCSLCVNRVDSSNMDAGCHPKLARTSYNQRSPFTPATGLLHSVFALMFTPGPEKYPWDGLKGYAMVYGVTRVTGATFANFYGTEGCNGTYKTHALGNHVKEPEAFHPVFLKKSNVQNVARSGLTFFQGPPDEWRNEADCDTINWSRNLTRLIDNDSNATAIADPSAIKLNCPGPLHVNFRDVDGSLTGTVQSVLGAFTPPRQFPYDQGTPLIPGPCQYSTTWQGYSCLPNSTAFELNPTLKPSPVPPTGIFGDPQHFVLESRDPDSEDRNFSPVFVNVSGSIELMVSAMDHGWCFAYTCQKRLSTFWTYLPSGQEARINFTGTPSRVFGLYWPYADPSAELVLIFNMQYTPNRRFIWTATRGRLNPLASPPKVGDGNGHGSFYWDQDNTILYVKMLGSSESLELRTENALMVSQTLAVSFDQFYDIKEMFLQNLAFLLGVPMSRIVVAKIVPGSTTLNFMLTESPASSAVKLSPPTIDSTYNVDASTAQMIKSLPADQQALWKANAAASGTSTSTSPPPPPSTTAPSPPGDVSLLNMVTNFVNLPSTIGNITVLASGIILNGAAIDPSLLAQIQSMTGNVPIVNPAPGSTPTTNSGTVPGGIVPGPDSSTTPGGSGGSGGTGGSGGGSTPAGSPSSSSESKSNTAMIGAIAGAVGGCALLAVLVAAYVIKKRRTNMYKPTGRVSPEASEAGIHPVAASVASESHSSPNWRQRSSAGGAVAPEPLAKAPLQLSPLGGKQAPPSTSTPSTPIKAHNGSTPTSPRPDSPRIFGTRPGSPQVTSPGYAPPSLAAGAGADAASPGRLQNLPAFPRAAPETWQNAARGRANLPALRQNQEGEWQQQPSGHNVMVAGSITANIPEVGGATPAARVNLPGAIGSLAGPAAEAAARDAVMKSGPSPPM